jgi:hypothetical protein
VIIVHIYNCNIQVVATQLVYIYMATKFMHLCVHWIHHNCY